MPTVKTTGSRESVNVEYTETFTVTLLSRLSSFMDLMTQHGGAAEKKNVLKVVDRLMPKGLGTGQQYFQPNYQTYTPP